MSKVASVVYMISVSFISEMFLLFSFFALVNTYKKINGNVPELIAIYYTSRMLKHLESLHLEGKVLVSSLQEVAIAA